MKIRMSSCDKSSWRKSLSRRVRGSVATLGILIWSGAGLPACGLATPAQSAPPVPIEGAEAAPPAASGAAASAAGQASVQQPAGSISGSVADPNGGPVSEALVTLGRHGQTIQQVRAADNGQFSFSSVAPGAYQLTVAASGFKTQSVSLVVRPGEIYTVPRMELALAPVVTTVTVTPSRGEVAQYQTQQEEKQLVLGFIPNYYVTYYHHTAPLSPKQKFQLAWKAVFNPYSLGLATAFVGGEQATGMYSGYGPDEEGFVKRFGAAYATLGVGVFVGDALLPSVLKQDPRFYYKGTSSAPSRFLYAITRSVICKGDNGHWQPDFSSILGHFAAGGIANLYLPQQNRRGWGATVENGLIGVGFDAVSNLLQEFVLPKLTPVLSHRRYGRP